jgi:hypothetical protein
MRILYCGCLINTISRSQSTQLQNIVITLIQFTKLRSFVFELFVSYEIPQYVFVFMCVPANIFVVKKQ